jgi:hypothetical protein
VQLEGMAVGDGAPAWEAAGFGVGPRATVHIDRAVIDLVGGERRGLRSWSLSSPAPDAEAALVDDTLDGLRTTLVDPPGDAPPAAPTPTA